MEGQRAEAAAAEAAAVADQAELHLPDGRDAARLLVGRMVAAHIGERVDVVHLHLAQGFCRRILDHVQVILVLFCQPLSREWVRIAVLDIKALRILPLVRRQRVIVRQVQRVVDVLQAAGFVDGAVHEGDVLHVHAAVQRFRDLHHGALAHAVGQKIRLGVNENRVF